jgi:hypothetical protein
LLFALNDLASAQNNLMSVWIGYQAATMRLYRDLGIMQLDDNNLWIETPLFAAERGGPEQAELPPEVPQSWFDALDRADKESQPATAPALLPPADGSAKVPIRSQPDVGTTSVDLDRSDRLTAIRRADSVEESGTARVSISSGNPDADAEHSQASPLERLGRTILRR